MALYRTYRPATFAEVVGQEHVTDPLSRALDSGRINHAYLFSGPRGCGKTSSARILARSLNCEQGPTSTPCGECSSCVALRPGGPGNLDVIELDAASHGGVDDTRELRDRAFYAPSESRYRVFIVDEAHMVTNAGFNALLKIVEEPPEHLIFVFATTEPEKVLPTIRSRTHHYPFRLLAPPVMRGLLERICAQERVTVAPEVYPLVIRAGGGSPRDSLSILDQLLAGADDQGVTYERALALLGVTDIALIDDAIDALAAADGAALFSTVERLVDAGHDPRRFAADLLERLRDLILLQAVPDAAARGLVEAPGDQLARMQNQIEGLGLASLTRFAETAHAALGEMRGTTSPRLLLEVMCARMLLPAASSDDAALLQRIERIESGVAPAGGPRPAVTAAGAAAVASSAAAAPAAEPETPSKFVRPSQRKAMEEAAAKAAADTEAEEAEADKAEDDPPLSGHESALSGHEPAPSGHDPAPSGHETPPQPTAEPSTAEPTPPAEHITPPPAPPAPATEMPQRPGTPTAPQPPARVPATQPRVAEPASEDDIPLPDEPVDEFDAPQPDESSVGVVPQPDPEPEPAAAEGDLESMRKRFQDVRLAVRERSKSLEPMLSAAVIERLDGDTVVLGHPIEVLVTRLSAPHAVEILRAALKEVFGRDLDVRTVKQTPGAASSGPGKQATQKPAPKRQTFDRPSRARAQGPAEDTATEAPPSAEPAPEPEEPEPPRADDEIPDDERAEMVADAHSGPSEGRLDPDQVAIELLKSELGARPLES